MADDARVLAFLRVIQPDRKQVVVVRCLRADGEQHSVVVSTLRCDDCIHKIGLRPAHLADFIKNRQRRAFAVGRLALGADGLILDVLANADDSLA